MMDPFQYLMQTATEILAPEMASKTAYALGIFALAGIAFYLILTLVRVALLKFGSRVDGGLSDVLNRAIEKPFAMIALLLAAYTAAVATFPSPSIGGRSLESVVGICVTVVCGLALAKAADAILVWYSTGSQPADIFGKRKVGEIFPMARKIVVAAIYILTLAIVLSLLGIEIAPLIAGLGIAGLAVALALQDTLSNFFSGLYILADKPVRTGDVIRLSDGTEGVVVEIGWRSTRLRTSEHNDVIIPNAQLSKEKILNYCSPSMEMKIKIDMWMPSDHDPVKTERILKRIAERVVHSSAGTVKAAKPTVQIREMAKEGVKYTIAVQIEEYGCQDLIRHRICRDAITELHNEGIQLSLDI